MGKDIKVEYGEKEVELSRAYPFAPDKKIKLRELNGFDDEAITKQINKGKLAGYVQIAVSAGIEYEEALSLAGKDSSLLIKELEGF